MATAGVGRRLSEVLQEQQEPFLLYGAIECCSSVNDKGAGASWARAVRRALPGWEWDGLAAGCFPCAARKRESFRRLPRAGHARCDDDDDDAVATESDGDGDDARRLSPVSVLDVLRCSDEEESSSSSSPPPTLRDWEEEDDDKPRSTSPGSSPPPDSPTDNESEEEWRKVVSSWERIAGDIARVPAMVALDLLSVSSTSAAREWNGELAAEAERVGASVEAMILEEMSAEAVRDMVHL